MKAMLRRILLLVVCGLSIFTVQAQGNALSVGDIEILTRTDVYGQEIRVAEGLLTNNGADAYNNISLMAEIYNPGGELVGEGLGYLVNACGAGLLPDYALQPGQSHLFEVRLELYEADAAVDRVEIIPQGLPAQVEAANTADVTGIQWVTNTEVVDAQWLDTQALRYAEGCYTDLFTELDWNLYSLRTNTTRSIVHPEIRRIDDAMLSRIVLTDPADFEHSNLIYAPSGRRVVFQDEVNRLFSAEPDGRFARLIYDGLHNRTLQGYSWLENDRFLAYYYGAYGDPVYYFTADIFGAAISMRPDNLPLSEIIPGASPGGIRAIIGGTFFERTGYYLTSLTSNNDPELILESELPGNNWPPPLFFIEEEPERVEIVYFARPVNGEARLQCMWLNGDRAVRDLAPLPLNNLTTEDRARWWASPDWQTIALGANGTSGGLWMIDLTQFPPCSG